MDTTLKDKVLDATDGGLRIIYSLYPDARNVVDGNAKKFKMRPEERTPSATIRKKSDGLWYVCDFGDDQREYNAIDAFMKYNNIAYFSEALHMLADTYNVDMTLKPEVNKALRVEFEDVEGMAQEGDFAYEQKEFTEAELKVWGAFVTDKVLERYHYVSLSRYSKVFRKKDTGRLTRRTVYASDNFPIFMHDCGSFQKIYCPLSYDKGNRFECAGNKPKDYVNGLEEAIKAYDDLNSEDRVVEGRKEKLPAIFICAGERDAMNVAGLGYYPIWLNSESADLSLSLMTELTRIAKRIYNIPDIDSTGVREGNKLALRYVDIYTIELPKWLLNFHDNRGKPRKDLRDFLDLRPSKYEFEKLVTTAMQAQFWQETTEKDGKERKKVEIKATNLLYFLRLNGFYKIKDAITGEVKPCRLNGYKVEMMDAKQLRDFIREDLRTRQVKPAVMEAYINSKRATQSVYDDLDNIEINFEVSTPTSRTFFFENCSVTVTADGIKVTNNKDVASYCMSSKVIPHRFTELPPAFHVDKETNTFYIDNIRSKVFRYLINGSRIHWKEEMETENAEEDAKYVAENRFNLYGSRLTPAQRNEQHLNLLNKIHTYGYLLHHFKKDDMAKCVWIMESKLTGEDESSGGSGKSLFMNVLKYTKLSDIVTLDGRDGDLTKNNHFLDRVSSSTDILFVDDAAKNFPFGTFYGKITGQLTVNPKGSQSFEIDYRKSPYTVISSNFPWKGDDRSTLRRLVPVLFCDYYHEQGSDGEYRETRKVSSDFGGQNLFGHDYADEDWNADYNFLFNCLQYQLANPDDITLPPMDRVMERVRNAMMGDGFKAWADVYFDNSDKENPTDKLDRILIKSNVYNDYCDTVGRTTKTKSAQSFKAALKIYCKERGWIFCPPTMLGWNAEQNRSTRNLSLGGHRKCIELIYIQTDPEKEISNSLPEGWF